MSIGKINDNINNKIKTNFDIFKEVYVHNEKSNGFDNGKKLKNIMSGVKNFQINNIQRSRSAQSSV